MFINMIPLGVNLALSFRTSGFFQAQPESIDLQIDFVGCFVRAEICIGARAFSKIINKRAGELKPDEWTFFPKNPQRRHNKNNNYIYSPH